MWLFTTALIYILKMNWEKSWANCGTDGALELLVRKHLAGQHIKKKSSGKKKRKKKTSCLEARLLFVLNHVSFSQANNLTTFLSNCWVFDHIKADTDEYPHLIMSANGPVELHWQQSQCGNTLLSFIFYTRLSQSRMIKRSL